MKRCLALILAAALLLSACGTTPVSGEKEENTARATPPTESAAPPASEPDVPEEADDPAEPEELISVDPGLFAPEADRYTLLDNGELRLELLFTRQIEGGGPLVIYRAENRCEEDYRVDITEVLLNGSVLAWGEETLTVPAQSVRQSSYHPGLNQSCAWIGFENLRDYAATLRLTRGAGPGGEPISCSAAFPEGIRLRLSYGSFREGRADRQVLKADEQVCIALLGCGSFSADFGTDCLRGFLWIENRGEEPIPAALSGISVNGVNLPFMTRSWEDLQPNCSCLLPFQVYAEEFDLAGIDSVESLSLQILTRDEENSGGNLSVAGGTWYPAALAVSGKAESAPIQGRVIYNDGLLQLSLVSARTLESTRAGVTNAEYTLYVVNRRTDGVSLYFSEPLVDDEPYENASIGGDYIDKKNIRFGPQSEGYTVLTLALPAETVGDAVPALSFLLQLRSQGGDSIFYTIPDRIRLETEEDKP